MATADPTAEFFARFDDPSEWGSIDDGIPIFIEHVVKGKDGKVKYKIGKEELERVAAKINENALDNWKPIKEFIGHVTPSSPKNPNPDQLEQPLLVGYSRDARVERWGPKGKWAVKVRRFIEKPYVELIRQYPERSADFYPGTFEITGVANLKTDPRLSMGMVVSRPGGLVQYSRGFGMDDDFELANDDAAKADDAASTGGAPIGDPVGDELSEDDRNKAEAYMRHYQKSFPWMGHAMKQYEASLAAPSAMNGEVPGGDPPEGGPAPGGPPEAGEPDGDEGGKPVQFSRREQPEQYARLVELEGKLASVDAERIIADLKSHRVKFDAAKLRTRLLKADEAGRAEMHADAIEHYARQDGTPADHGWLDIAKDEPKASGIDPFNAGEYEPTTQEILQYGADPRDDHGWRAAREALIAEKQKKRSK